MSPGAENMVVVSGPAPRLDQLPIDQVDIRFALIALASEIWQQKVMSTAPLPLTNNPNNFDN